MRHRHGDGGDPPVLTPASGRDVEKCSNHVAGRPDGGGRSRSLMVGPDHFDARRDYVLAPAILAGLAIGGGQAGPHGAVGRRAHAGGGLIEGLEAGGEDRGHGGEHGGRRGAAHPLASIKGYPLVTARRVNDVTTMFNAA